MKILFAIVFLFLITSLYLVKKIKYNESRFLSGKKILTVYYSNGGNTEDAAKNIQFVVGGDIKEIKLNEEYPKNIFKLSKFVRDEMEKGN